MVKTQHNYNNKFALFIIINYLTIISHINISQKRSSFVRSQCTDKGWAGGDGAPRARAAPPPAQPSRVTLPVFVVISPLKLLQRTSDYCTSINMTSPAITKSPDNQKGEKKSPSHSAGAPAEAAATEPAAASAPAPPAETFSWLRIFKLADLMMKQGC
ncbi:uncharacterized protein LOC119693523 [Plutella xylostella]|uniref:uncharacterized protein LOC119693523 n=1 Tax=Plutella xylostella TaxID=51655 RepID=UPI002032DC25|nr:uncharacterized protein LOC119693523 [Plutella xylostella]